MRTMCIKIRGLISVRNVREPMTTNGCLNIINNKVAGKIEWLVGLKLDDARKKAMESRISFSPAIK
jgi:hypothetical protein